MKTTLKTLALASIVATGFVTGCDRDDYGRNGTEASRTAGQELDDKKLEGNVKDALSADSVKYPDVKVSAYKGVVQLSGFVNERDQKNRAGDLAGKVSGVEKVVNNITVKADKNP
jgi:osmotically-inducible protein OsmY